MAKYNPLEKTENDRIHYETLGKGLTEYLKSGIDYVRNSKVGKAAGRIKDEIGYSIETDKAALKNPQTRKRWFLNKALQFAPEIITGAYLLGYAISDHNYYSNQNLSDLARAGNAVKGTILVPWGSASIPKPQSDGFIHWNDQNSRHLYPIIENRIGGAVIGTLPTDVKYGYKGIKRVLGKENKK